MKRGYAYFMINATGINREYKIVAGYLRPEDDPVLGQVPGLSAGQVGWFNTEFGLQEGDRVPVSFTMSASVCRDATRVAQRLLAHLSEAAVEHTYGFGLSCGANLLSAVITGREEQSYRCPASGCSDPRVLARTGGNYDEPYVPASGEIFDGAIIFDLYRNTCPRIVVPQSRTDPEYPLQAPLIMIHGQGDPWFLAEIEVAGSAAVNGADLDQDLRIFQVRNLPHDFVDLNEKRAPDDQADRIMPMVVAMLENLDAQVSAGTPLPASRIDGRLGDGGENPDRLFFEQADGSLTDWVPFPDDPRIDEMHVDLVHQINRETEAWKVVTQVHQHEPEAIRLPSTCCRLGGAYIEYLRVTLIPFEKKTLKEMYGDLEGYLQCLTGCLDDLGEKRLYDRELAEAALTEEYIAPLFKSGDSGCACAQGKQQPASIFLVLLALALCLRGRKTTGV
jgi:hypothetical protein